MKVLIEGPPASGKGAQCELLVQDFRLVHVSTGDMLRDEVKAGSELGKKAKVAMDRGELLDDDIMIKLVLDRLKKSDCMMRGWVLDGFPRSKAQADALIASGIQVDALVVLEVPASLLVERAAGRRYDPKTRRTYHVVTNPPPLSVKHRIIQRSDDTKDAVTTRITEYNKNLLEVISKFNGFHGKLPVIARIDGKRKPKEVYREVRSAVVARLWTQWKGQTALDGTNYRFFGPEITDPNAPVAVYAETALHLHARVYPDTPAGLAEDGTPIDAKPVPGFYTGFKPLGGFKLAPPPLPVGTPVIVLIHSTQTFSAVWDNLAKAITEQVGVRVLAYDLIGRGHSGKAFHEDSVLDGAMHVKQLRRLLEEVGLGAAPVVLIGHSMGAAIAALYVEEHGGPNGVRMGAAQLKMVKGNAFEPHVVGVGLLAPSGLMDAGKIKAARQIADWAPEVFAKVLQNTEVDSEERDYIKPGSDGPTAALRAQVIQAEKNPQAFVAFYRTILSFPLFGMQKTAEALGASHNLPVLLLWGDHDKIVRFNPNHGRWLAALRKGVDGKVCELTDCVLRGLGHGCFIENANLVYPHIIGWLKTKVLETPAHARAAREAEAAREKAEAPQAEVGVKRFGFF